MPQLGEVARHTTARPRTTQSSEPPPQPESRVTFEDIQARTLARRTKKMDTRVANNAVVTEYVNISAELLRAERDLEPLKHPKSLTIPVQEVNEERAKLEAVIRSCKEDLAWFKANYDDILPKVARREQLQASARNAIAAIKRFDPSNRNEEAEKDFLKNALENGVLTLSGDSYVAAIEGDEVLKDLEDEVDAYHDQVKTAREIARSERAEFVAKYLLSDYPVIQDGVSLDSPLQAEKNRPGLVSYTRLRTTDKGERAFVRVLGTELNEAKEPTGRTYFMGEALIERVSGNLVVVKASRVPLCEIMFYQKDRNTQKLVEKGVITIPTDLENLHPKLLRDAIKRQMARDAEFDSRREKAKELSAAENFPDAVTFNEFKNGEGKRWVVNALWTATNERGKEEERRVIFHVESDGKNFHIGESAYDLERVDKDFFGMYVNPTPLSALTTDKRWLALAGLNRESEVVSQLRKEAKSHGNTTFITKETVANALGLEGVDGTYSGYTRWEQYTAGIRHDGPRYTYLGYNVVRREGKVAITWATPGMAENVARDVLGEAYLLTDIHHPGAKTILRGIWMGVMRDGKTIPAHLK